MQWRRLLFFRVKTLIEASECEKGEGCKIDSKLVEDSFKTPTGPKLSEHSPESLFSMSPIHRCPRHCYENCHHRRSVHCQEYFGEDHWVYWWIAVIMFAVTTALPLIELG